MSMVSLDLVNLSRLMERSSGRQQVVIALLDGPVAIDHPDLSGVSIQAMPGGISGTCAKKVGGACRHGTFVAGVLVARRESQAPSICPNCTLLVRPIFDDDAEAEGQHSPSTTPAELAGAIVECVDAGGRVLNVSAAMADSSIVAERELEDALDHAGRRGAIVVAAAGNQGTVGGSPITRHPSVIPVVAYGLNGRPVPQSNLGASMGRWGLGAPGEAVTSLSPGGEVVTLGGTSFAAPFVTGAIALLWSEFSHASAVEIKGAILQSARGRRRTVVPPLLDAWESYQALTRASAGRAR